MTRQILAARLRAWWPDFYLSLIVLAPTILALVDPDEVLGSIGLGQLLPGWLAYTWAAAVFACCIAAMRGVVVRNYPQAAAFSLALCVLLAANATVTVSANGLGASYAAGMYAATALMYYDRYSRLRAPVPLPPGMADRTKGRA
jgi:hypothetical protein